MVRGGERGAGFRTVLIRVPSDLLVVVMIA
jgi:hypothetical protein